MPNLTKTSPPSATNADNAPTDWLAPANALISAIFFPLPPPYSPLPPHSVNAKPPSVFEDRGVLFCRARRLSDHLPVVLKYLSPEMSTPEKTSAIEHAYKLGSELNLPGLLKIYALERHQTGLLLIEEDFAGRTLDVVAGEKDLPVERFLRMAVRISEIVESLHQHKIVHKNLNPSTILWDSETEEARITGLCIASDFSSQKLASKESDFNELIPCYMSPEQTGRMNRAVDYRTDFYSLGIVFYEMLTGHPPFISGDLTGLVHCHIAKIPRPPHEINPLIPEKVSSIILCLLEKNPDNRYLSAAGLKNDFQKCLTSLRETGDVGTFELKQADYSDEFYIPEKIYGRNADLQALTRELEKVCNGSRGLFLVSGFAGLGKTALVHELVKTLANQRAYFLEGKFNKHSLDVPYSGWIDAFDNFVKQILKEGGPELAHLKGRILKAVSHNGKVLTDLLPHLELLIGQQPDLVPLRGLEATNRFNHVFKNVIKAISGKKHPLVIFLDDLQWIDAVSLALLDMLMSVSKIECLMVIGAYRNDDVDEARPLLAAVDKMAKEGIHVAHLQLQALGQDDVQALVAETMHCQYSEASSLSTIIHARTAGNPLFIIQVLHSLARDQMLRFDHALKRWQWNLAEIRTVNITDNVVELLAGKLQKLPVATQEILKLAASVGNQVDLSTLQIISGHPLQQLQLELLPAAEEGFLFALNGGYKFSHDRIQQSAYSLIPEKDRKAYHLKIGKSLLASDKYGKDTSLIFEIANHFNLAKELYHTPQEKADVVQVNLLAAKKAKAATAYGTAAKYIDAAFELLADDSWQRNYDFTLELFKLAIEVEYLNTRYDKAKQLADQAIAHARGICDTAKLTQLKLITYTQQQDYVRALEVGLAVLSILGVELKNKMPPTFSLSGFTDLPVMSNPEKQIAMEVMTTMMAPAYILDLGLYKAMTYTMIELSLKYGSAPSTIYACGLLGSLAIAEGDIDQAYALGNISMNLVEKLHVPEMKCRALNMFNSCIRHWKEPLPEAIIDMRRGIDCGLEFGDIENASYCAIHYCATVFFAGVKLELVEQTVSKNMALMENLKQHYAISHLNITLETVRCLRNGTAGGGLFSTETLSGKSFLAALVSARSHTVLFWFHTARAIVNYHFRNFEQAVGDALQAEAYVDNATGLVSVGEHCFYYSLALLARYPAGGEISKTDQTVISVNLEKLKRWAFHAPCNYQHKCALVESEMARVNGHVAEAIEGYETAISGAKANRYVPEAALAYELAGRCYLERGMTEIAGLYLTQSRHAYAWWQARAKVRLLEKLYPQLISSERQSVKRNVSHPGIGLTFMDLDSVMKATQAISSEIVLDNLMLKLMKISIEYAGAQRGSLLLKQDDQWMVVAQGDMEDPETQVLHAVGIDNGDRVSSSVVHYVARTHETVVLDNASESTGFATDPHIMRNQAKSILCVPLLQRGELRGMLYLENNLSTQVFSVERIKILEILATQAGISLENARYYDELTKLNHSMQQEISERRQVEQTLQISEENFRAAFEQAAVGIAWVGTDGRWLRVNQKLCKMVGYTAEEMLKLTFQDITHPDDLDADLDFVRRLLAGEITNYAMVKRYIRKDHSTVWINLTVGLVHKDDGAPKYFISVIEDISLRHDAQENNAKLESQLRQAQKMEAIGQLAGGVAHDFNNMLSVINGYSEVILDELNPADPNYSRIQEINRAGKRSVELTRQLLTFARKQTITPKILDLNDLVADMFKMLQRLIGENIELVWKPSPKLWKIKIDPSQINQLLTNLLVNARDAISGVGKIVIETGQAEFDEQSGKIHPDLEPGKYVTLGVGDNGCGMDKQTLEHLFEPFYTTKEVGKGTGLGLSTVFGIVRQNNGFINVNSEVGRGATFKIYLPAHELTPGEIEESAKKSTLLKGTETVLVVEDEVSLLRLIKTRLERLDYTVLDASSPLKAIKLSEEYTGHIDLLLSDVIMPEMNGKELSDRIMSMRPGIKCLFMSGYNADIITKKGVLDETIHFIQKPFSGDDVAAKLREILS